MYKGSADAKTAEDSVSEKICFRSFLSKQLKVDAFEQVKDEFDSDQSGLDDFS